MPRPCFFNGVDAGIVEDHIHNYERWLGAQPGQIGPGSQSSLTGFRLTSNATANQFGTAITILDGTETPTAPGMTLFDFHRMLLVGVQNSSKTYRIRFANNNKGHTSWAAAAAAGVYSDICLRVDTAPVHGFPYDLFSHRLPAGTTIWAAVATADSVSQWIDIMVGIHEYQ